MVGGSAGLQDMHWFQQSQGTGGGKLSEQQLCLPMATRDEHVIQRFVPNLPKNPKDSEFQGIDLDPNIRAQRPLCLQHELT